MYKKRYLKRRSPSLYFGSPFSFQPTYRRRRAYKPRGYSFLDSVADSIAADIDRALFSRKKTHHPVSRIWSSHDTPHHTYKPHRKSTASFDVSTDPLSHFEAEEYSVSQLRTASHSYEASLDKRYKLKKSLLTETEMKFFDVLKTVVAEEYHILLQMQLSRIVIPVDSRFGYTNYPDFNRIKAKSIDFVLYNDEYEPIVAIELDDPSHMRKNRITRDTFVDDVMQQVGLPIVHVPAAYSYDTEDLYNRIFPGDVASR